MTLKQIYIINLALDCLSWVEEMTLLPIILHTWETWFRWFELDQTWKGISYHPASMIHTILCKLAWAWSIIPAVIPKDLHEIIIVGTHTSVVTNSYVVSLKTYSITWTLENNLLSPLSVMNLGKESITLARGPLFMYNTKRLLILHCSFSIF